MMAVTGYVASGGSPASAPRSTDAPMPIGALAREGQAGSEETRVPRNEPAAEEDLAALARHLLGDHPAPEDVIAAYDAALHATWAQLALLIGDLGAHAVFDRALQIAQADTPPARAIVLGETAFDLHALAAGTGKNTGPRPDLALDALCRGCGEVIISLLGSGLYAAILRGVARQLAPVIPPQQL